MNVSHLSIAVLILGTFTILILGLALLIALGNKRREALLRRYDLILTRHSRNQSVEGTILAYGQ